ncbi:protein mono-ADP-ribosyltransferase PARP10 [Bombina bombina]|uniref:protein mono-ADP-ribosyltransferase PARP10 n=1 Tax=Bombina bombina TaxID=8345 RepID=UPI00235ABEF9|nr:protein mono-ADP-ribosyltransferase PARP10 [Bombina bombina]
MYYSRVNFCLLVVRDILNKEHCLLDSQLKFSLYYPKLLGLPTTHGSETQEQESVQGMRQDCTTHRSVQLMEQSTDRGEQSNSKEQLSRTERSQRQQSTVDSQQSEKKQICEAERPPREEIRQPSAADRQHNGQLPTDGHQCSVQLQDEISVHVGAFKTEDRSVTMVDNAEQVDTEVSMQPAQLRFLQERHHELLAGMDEVTIVPLEHEDKTGFMVSGTAPICQSVAELLHTLVSSLSTSSVLLEYPGISRFLLEPDGQQILQAIESQYNCVIDTSQLSLKALDSEYVDPWSYVPDVLPTKIMTDESPPQEELLQPADMEGIRVLASLLQNTNSVDNGMTCQSSEEEPQLQSSSIGLNISPEDTELDIYSESTSCDKDDDENVVDKELEKAFAMSRVEFQERELDEEAELLLAIQRSMDVRQLSTQEEDEAIKRALEMSLREQVLEETEESLQIALKRSLTANRADGEMVEDQGSTLEEIDQALGTAQLIVVAEEKNELIAACMALRKAVKGKLCTESVEAIVDLHIKNSGILSALQRKHRVSITVGNRQIVIEGFSSSPSNCHQELLEIISFLQEKNRRTEDQDVQQLPYHVTYKRPRTSDNVQIGVEFVSVAEDSEEFASIVKPFYNTLEELENCIQILEVQRVHNTLLDNQYELKKRSVEASDTRKPVERVLYHGTTESSAMEICHHGFNRSFCGKNGERQS